MNIGLRLGSTLLLALLALQPTSATARTRVMMCASCGTVIDADPIYYARDRAPAGASAGTIVGSKDTGGLDDPDGGLIGRDARRSEQGDDAKGLRLELRMDGGGRRIIEVAEGTRVYKRDRVRIEGNRMEVFD